MRKSVPGSTYTPDWPEVARAAKEAAGWRCERCHLTIQAKVVMERYWMFEHTEWFKPHAAGYYASIQRLPQDREYVMANMEMLLARFVFVQKGKYR